MEFEHFTPSTAGSRVFLAPPRCRSRGRRSCRCPGQTQPRVSRVSPPRVGRGEARALPSGHGAEPLNRPYRNLPAQPRHLGRERVRPTEGSKPSRLQGERLGLNQIQTRCEIRAGISGKGFCFTSGRGWSGAPGLVCPAAPEEENRNPTK